MADNPQEQCPICREPIALPCTTDCNHRFCRRVDNVYGDRNLICTLLSVSQMAEEAAAATA